MKNKKSIFEEIEEIEQKSMKDVRELAIKINTNRRKEARIPTTGRIKGYNTQIIVKTSLKTGIELPKKGSEVAISGCA